MGMLEDDGAVADDEAEDDDEDDQGIVGLVPVAKSRISRRGMINLQVRPSG